MTAAFDEFFMRMALREAARAAEARYSAYFRIPESTIIQKLQPAFSKMRRSRSFKTSSGPDAAI